MSEYDIGDTWVPQATFKTNAVPPVLTDTTVAVKLTDPDGIVTTPTAVHVSTGIYNVSVSITKPGVWYVKFTGTGAIPEAVQSRIFVRRDWP